MTTNSIIFAVDFNGKIAHRNPDYYGPIFMEYNRVANCTTYFTSAAAYCGNINNIIVCDNDILYYYLNGFLHPFCVDRLLAEKFKVFAVNLDDKVPGIMKHISKAPPIELGFYDAYDLLISMGFGNSFRR